MFFTSKNQTLYPASLEYNFALVLSEVARIAKKNGATVKALTPGYIVNRSIFENISKREDDIHRLEGFLQDGKTLLNDLDEKRTAAVKNAIAKYQDEITALKAIKNDPVKLSHTSYVIFVLDGVYYDFCMPDNIFDNFYYHKTPVINGEYNRYTYGNEMPKDWFVDDLWRYACKKSVIKAAATAIYSEMINGKISKPAIDTYRRRVSNSYNNGYHYETISKPIRLEKISWLQVEK